MDAQPNLNRSHPCSLFNTDLAGRFDKAARALLEEQLDNATAAATHAILEVFKEAFPDHIASPDITEEEWDRLWEAIRASIIIWLDSNTYLL